MIEAGFLKRNREAGIMKHIIIGTAGHIDHGKTTLIRALTGRNTDRLQEEQRRGITIELGFTWFDMKDGTRCGIIDVPGHEKFVGNMVSGVVGMDLVIMVVAADEGIMPQTVEHLDILELLGIQKTILVLNKCDLVDEEWLELMEEETREKLQGTIMEKAPIVRVSAATGEGIEELKDVILNMVKNEVEERDVNSIPRLPIDRVFTISGFGTIVTGTLISGTINKSDTLELFPIGKECKIRGIQVHEKDQEKCEAGQRVAINIANIRKEDIYRGCVIAPIGSMQPTDRVDVKVQILKDSNRILTNRERLHLYTGTSEVLCRAVILDKEELGPGESGLAQLVLEEPIVVKRGDRFVIRFYSPVETIGGGIVLEPNPKKKKRFNEAAIEELNRKESGSLADVCEFHIREKGEELMTLAELAKVMAHSQEELLPYLEELKAAGSIYQLTMKKDTYYWHKDSMYRMQQDMTRDLTRYHEKYPYRYGMRKAEFHNMYMKKVKQNVFDECMKLYAEQGIFSANGEFMSLQGFSVTKDEKYLAIEKLLTDTLENAGYEILRFNEIDLKGYPEPVVMDVLQMLLLEEKVVRCSEEWLTMKHYMDEAKEKIEAFFAENDLLTFIQVRDMFGTSRKCAKVIVEYMDSIKVTKKLGAETERVAAK